MLTNLFLSLGINRDHWSLLWGKILSIALLVNSGVFDLTAQAAYLGIHLSPTGAHWIQALAVIALYISGQYSTSSLPSKKVAVWLIAAMLGTGVLVSGCATLTAKLPHLPDGSLDVRQLVSWASVGVEADCQFAATSSWCVLGRDVIADATSAMDKNPTNLRAAVKQSLNDSMAKWPAIKPVFGWLNADLD